MSASHALTESYNDLPNAYLQDQHTEFLACDEQILFCHIREGEQIAHFIEKAKEIGQAPISLLIRSSRCSESYGNASDDDVENYPYDFIYQNDLPLEEAEADFISFLEGIMKG